MGSNGVELVDQVLNAMNSEFAQVLLNDCVVGEGNALSIHFGITSFIDEFSDNLPGWVSIGDAWLNLPQHLNTGLVHSHECTIVELSQFQQSQGLSHSWCQCVDTMLNRSKYPLILVTKINRDSAGT